MSGIGKIGQFQKFFGKLIHKNNAEIPQEVMQEIHKSLRNKSGYKDAGNVKIYSVDLNAADAKILVLADGSQWSPAGNLGLNQNHALHWSVGETISLRSSGGKMYVLTNLDMREASRWIFQGYVENWGEPNEVVIKSATIVKNQKLEYKPTNQLLTIKSVKNTGYTIILSDGSRWSRHEKDFSLNDYTEGAVVKVLMPGLQGWQVVRDIEIQNKGHKEHWYFDGFEKS